ncbi:GAF domain-containing protein [Azospirillum picis]|uniref:GAF domain-containing protein n=1 Tax=Azospirillum picis TaxID=488438 RepID=A0ABU0MP80_9PROT|nr:GAF domain-containing protein [Azospirillum picis]MBP2301440.1 GAF domain-containing protein [Azospirillum picis]MDQ0535272.1 GAF domain-containing protein [Azospirillum picis]
MDRTRAAVFGLRIGHATVEDVWRAACEDIVESAAVSRAGVWAFSDDRESLTCLNLFDGGPRRHSRGTILLRTDYPDYFRAITNNARVVADDAPLHPATRCFADTYFKENDVRSLLDFIVLREAVPVGILCCEQSGWRRDWSPADSACLQAVAMLIGTVFPRCPDDAVVDEPAG